MKRSQRLRQKSRRAALQCATATAILVAACVWGIAACLYQSPLGISVAWVVAILALCACFKCGNHSINLIDQARDYEKWES